MHQNYTKFRQILLIALKNFYIFAKGFEVILNNSFCTAEIELEFPEKSNPFLVI